MIESESGCPFKNYYELHINSIVAKSRKSKHVSRTTFRPELGRRQDINPKMKLLIRNCLARPIQKEFQFHIIPDTIRF